MSLQQLASELHRYGYRFADVDVEMSKTETWVQTYSRSHSPGPDGAPSRPSDRHYLPMSGLVWEQKRTTQRDVRGGRLTQRWARIR